MCRVQVLLMLQFHLVRRLAETYLVMVYPKGAKMHLIAYVFGLSYYAGVGSCTTHARR